MRRIEGASKESYAHTANAITAADTGYQIRRTKPVVKIFALID